MFKTERKGQNVGITYMQIVKKNTKHSIFYRNVSFATVVLIGLKVTQANTGVVVSNMTLLTE